MDRPTESILLDVVREEMNLGVDQVWVRDQNKEIPNDNRIYITGGLINAETISVKEYMRMEGEDQISYVDVQQHEYIQFDIYSGGSEATKRRWEVIAALSSLRARQAQELENFKIQSLSQDLNNTSDVEGGSQLNRFSLSFPCIVWYRKSRILSDTGEWYYDQFDTRIDDQDTIDETSGLIEFSEP